MRISQVLTPELILGLRGPEAAIRWYKAYLDDISQVGMIDGHKGGIMAGGIIRNVDPITRDHFAIAWKYRKSTPKNFYVGKDFLEAIYQVRSEVPIDLLPEKFFGYFAFPPKTIFDQEGDEVLGGFVYVGPANETSINTENKEQNKVMWCSWHYPPKQEFIEKGSWGCQTGGILAAIDEHATVKETLDASKHIRGGEFGNQIVLLFANLVLYITKADPDLLPLKSVDFYSHRERKELEQKHGVANECGIPLTLVSWNYNKPKTYHVDETTVRGFFRWQRHGPGLSLLKFIWIDEHVRRFRNESKENLQS